MKSNSIIKNSIFIVCASFSFLFATSINAQVNVALDNWFNKEINKKTGLPYHYLWSDSAWSGYSRWGKIFTDKGAKLSTIDQPTDAILKNVDVYIMVDPDSTNDSPTPNYIMPKDIEAIDKFVRLGGVLVILANDSLTCEFTHLNRLSRKFGINFVHTLYHPVKGKNFEMGASTNLPEYPVFKDVKKIYIKEISTLTLTGVAKPVLVENGNVLIAEVNYGKGFVWAIGDPWIYNEYIDHDRLPADFDNRKAAENLTDYLLSKARKK
jgi:unsaturated rhamnogalacturonyl hydrolase